MPDRPQSGGPGNREKSHQIPSNKKTIESIEYKDNDEEQGDENKTGNVKKSQKVFIREKQMKLKEMEENLKRERIASQEKLKRLIDRSLEPPQL